MVAVVVPDTCRLRPARPVLRTATRVVLAVTVLAGAALSPAAGRAETTSSVPSVRWATDGAVDVVLPAGRVMYLGGRFTHVGPYSGSGVPVDRTSGRPERVFPHVDGSVYAVAADGRGGWYVGGAFGTVGGVRRGNLVHVKADGRVDPAWNPRANAAVWAIGVSGRRVYVGGAFTSVGGRRRNRIAALDTVTGRATGFDPGANATVQALAVSGALVYVGGTFRYIDRQPRAYLAAVNARTGRVTMWNPRATGNYNGYVGVFSLAVSRSAVYAGGYFTAVGGRARHHLAAVSTGGRVMAWNPNPDSFVRALAVSDRTVYAGGSFRSIGGRSRSGIAALDASTGRASSWNPRSDRKSVV